jgi:hypothetical protein
LSGKLETHPSSGRARIAVFALLIFTTVGPGCVQQPAVPAYSSRAVDPYAAKRWSSPTFTTAHATYGEAVKHFLNMRPEPQQPIEFPHNIHNVNEIGIECTECHTGVARGAQAGLPSVNFCMTCHEDLGDPKDARIQMLRATAQRGEDMPWQRVYGFLEESHVRFNHAPHIRSGVDCATCHGDLTQMTVAERVVDHTMGFCVKCHEQKGASKDCLACHY